MKKSTKRLLGGLALAAGAFGAAGAYLTKKKKMSAKPQRATSNPASVWARPGMTVTFRAELMPGRDREARTARVKELLPSGRVLLYEVAGEHAEKEFDPVK
jgi:plastocyanin